MSDTQAIQGHLEPILEILQDYVLQEPRETLPPGFRDALDVALDEARFLQVDSVTDILERLKYLVETEGTVDVQELLPVVFALQDTLQSVTVEITPDHDFPEHLEAEDSNHRVEYLRWDAQTDQDEVLALSDQEQFLADGALGRGLSAYVLRVTFGDAVVTSATVREWLETDLSVVRMIVSDERSRITALVVDVSETAVARVLERVTHEYGDHIKFEVKSVDPQRLTRDSLARHQWYRDHAPFSIALEPSALDRMRFFISRLESTVSAEDKPVVQELLRTLEGAVSVNLRDVVNSLRPPLEELARGEEKKIILSYGGNADRVPGEINEVLLKALGELVRNAIHHGIETPRERQEAGKSSEGSIRVYGSMDGQVLTVRVTDDGRGIHEDDARVAMEKQSGGLGELQRELSQRLGGAVTVRSGSTGTTAAVTLPVTTGGWTGLLCSRETRPFVVPVVLIADVIPVRKRDVVEDASGGRFLRYRDRQLLFVEPHLPTLGEQIPVPAQAVVLAMHAGEFAIALDDDPQRVVVVPDGPGTVRVPEHGLKNIPVSIQPPV